MLIHGTSCQHGWRPATDLAVAFIQDKRSGRAAEYVDTHQSGAIMQFRYTILYVDDVAETIEFYEYAFGLRRKMIHESGDYGELATGGTSLSFSSKKLMKQIGKSPGNVDPLAPTFEIAFETEDVAANLKRALDAGAILVQDVAEMPWGQTTAYVRDKNGFLIELCTAVKA